MRERTITKGQLRYVSPYRNSTRRRAGPAEPFREIARAEGFIMARNGDDFPWVFDVDEWESLARTPSDGSLN
jgi:hypothetical protein